MGSNTEVTREQLRTKRLIVPLSELTPWDKNPRKISKEKFERLKEDLQSGQFKPLLVTNEGLVVGGNMSYRAMLDLGYKDAWASIIEFADELGKTVVYINGERSSKDFKSKEDAVLHFALVDNQQYGEYDTLELAELALASGIDLEKYHIPTGQLISLKDIVEEVSPSNEVIEDEPPEASSEPAKSKLGFVYKLGRHRLICGDSTKMEDVKKLMDGQKADMVFTDPPYGIGYVGKTEDALTIENDRKKPDELKSFWVAALTGIQTFMKDNGSYYVCSPQGSEMMMMMMMMIALKECGFQLKQTLIWAKNTLIMGHSDYQYQHEVIFYGWKEGFTHKFYGDRTQTSVWNFNKPAKSDLHPTMKPIELCAKAIRNSSLSDGSVLDIFGGSGSTLIACEQLNRICYMMEIDEKYCDVIRKRYAKFIGKEDKWEQVTPWEK